MEWLTDPLARAQRLPAVWLVETDQRPANQPERTSLRRAVATRVIASQLGIDPGAFTLGQDGQGRPVLAVFPALGLSYATRGGVVIVALADAPVGADVELVEPLADLPWNVLHAQERNQLEQLPETQREAAFYRLWTAKEAWLKATGAGLVAEPSSFAIRLDGDDAHVSDNPSARVFTRIIDLGRRRFAAAVAL